MMAVWSLRLLPVLAGTLLIASTTADVQQTDGPMIITPSQKEIILQSGQNYTLICRGKRPLRFMQQEIPEEVMGYFVKEERNETFSNDQYELALDLYNVDHFAVGYYACFDDSVDSAEVLSNIIEEPNNTAHIAYVYVYVNGSFMFAPMRALVLAKGDSKFLVECRPTTPDIKVKLTVPQSNKTPDPYKSSPKIGFIIYGLPKRPEYKCEARRGNENATMYIRNTITQPPQPTISGGSPYFLENETFSINCTVITQRNLAVALLWKIPGPLSKVLSTSNEYAVTDEHPVLYNNYTITNATKEDDGEYTCMSTNSNGSKNKTFVKHFLDKPVIMINKTNNLDVIEVVARVLRVKVKIKAYPPANISFLRDNKTLPKIPEKYITTILGSNFPFTDEVLLTIRQLQVSDTAIYTIYAQNENVSNMVTFDVRIRAPPVIDFGPETDKKYLINTTANLKCEATGYPLPSIEWIFSDNTTEGIIINKDSQKDIVENKYKITSMIEVPVRVSGYITCKATNNQGDSEVTRGFLVYEMPGGFGIQDSTKTWFAEGQNVALTCLASKYEFYNVSWYTEDEVEITNVHYFNSEFSYIATLDISHITVVQAGLYKCIGRKKDGSIENETISITVAETRLPVISDAEEKNIEVLPYRNFNITCEANAVPPPEIKWLKNLEPVLNSSSIKILSKNINHTAISSMLKFEPMQEENAGKYECVVTSQNSQRSKLYTLTIKEKPSNKTMYLSVIGVIFFILILLVAYLTWKIRKEKQFRKELAAAGLLYFKEGVTKSINPDLGIDEQAELLPYDEKFEFPAEKLILGKQLGAGAFGVVYKAEARGIVNAEETTTVAVKMVKKTADNMYIKALASELKIMVHLGKHINIVNLLGACTKNVGKRELIVIVEYCKFGNIHNYLQKHREVFKDTLTDNQEKTLGKDNRGFSSSGNSGYGDHSSYFRTHSDYFGSTHTQDTDHTFLNTANTNLSGRKDNTKQVEFVKVSETGYVQPEWRSNYECDYSYDGRSPRPLFSRDLLAWAFQIARGMEYLASRKVLHGDLAARNILLADDNIVKICDFGLAKSIYKNDEYQKKENSPLPVKWLAIECMTDRIFSTQSDIWSFGIVLWELFTLAKTPYPNISPSQLLQWLSEGNRLEKPVYADDRLYDLMRRCWDVKPTSRPSFSQLQEILGSFLEDNVRNHYVDLNDTYMNLNKQRTADEDYLAMVSAPDYNNLVTPSPHHYVNDSRRFFPPTPTQLQHDDEGYLQMSPASRQNSGIFNARAPGTKFDFDDRKTPRVSEANSCGSELTPMLTLNNLPRSGSESDHEGNASPYLNMCPRIEEETDEVFEMKKNNAKNIQPSAVANPTYTYTFNENEKKPQDFTNSYSNINVPNGLVK